MTIIVDRRGGKSAKNASNRKKFVDRYKRNVRKSVEDAIKNRSIKDANKPIDVPLDSTNEPVVDYDRTTGDYEHVISGNEDYIKGDQIEKPDESQGGRGTGSGEGDDDYSFTLTKEEFYELFFDELDLPDFIKEAMIDTTKLILKRAGYTKDGTPARLDIKKSMEMSIARRISSKMSEKRVPFLDDVDLRYRHFKQVPQPMLKAVMFCVMDVSGSMTEHHKLLSKKFFIFLYLFLTKNYEKVEVRFIRYHHQARECDEQEFFYARDTGGTCVMEALDLVNKIIEEEYPTETYNIYISHTSDGDYGWNEEPENINNGVSTLLEQVQYYAYLQVQDSNDHARFVKGDRKLLGVLEAIPSRGKKLNCDYAFAACDIYPVLVNLFKKRGS